ncbi:MAG: 16S rRNA (cytidine(1402)-2'-O)-methyltransferase [Cellvibrionaceae bacterium]
MSVEVALYIVATPIGNLGDMTPRAIEILQQVDLIAAEDTRHSAKLMNHCNIRTPLVSYHDHGGQKQVDRLLGALSQGKAVALISDAGTPLISDPGYQLVHQVREQGYKVVPVPGACAFVAALSASGLPSDRFWFEGFLPAKTAGRKSRLEALSTLPATLIFYESRHRIVAAMEDVVTVLGERQACVAREITKQFETLRSGSLGDICQWLTDDENQQKGEFVVMVAGADKEASGNAVDGEQVLKILLPELPVKKAAALAAQISGEKKNALYQRALELKES